MLQSSGQHNIQPPINHRDCLESWCAGPCSKDRRLEALTLHVFGKPPHQIRRKTSQGLWIEPAVELFAAVEFTKINWCPVHCFALDLILVDPYRLDHQESIGYAPSFQIRVWPLSHQVPARLSDLLPKHFWQLLAMLLPPHPRQSRK